MGRLRIGIVGVGGAAGMHFRALRGEANADIVGLTDIDPERVAHRSREWGVPGHADLAELLRRVDAVFVCTPPGAHLPPVEQAAAAGVHVYCEKPIALDLADADAMIAACRRAGVVLQIGHNFHFHPGYRAMWRAFQEGRLGELATCWMRLFAHFPTRGWAERRRAGHWRMRPEDSGGRLFEQIHLVNWLHWIGGPVRSVYGRALSIAPELPVDDLDLAVLNFDRGYGLAELAMTPTTVSDSSAGIIGTRAGVVLRGERLLLRRFDAADEVVLETPPVPSRQREFLDCVRQGRQPENDGADGRRSLAVCLAFARSAREGGAVEVVAPPEA